MHICETERLLLRRLNLQDAPFILELLNDPSWIGNIGDKQVHSLEDARQYLEGSSLRLYREYGFGLFMVEIRSTGTTGMGSGNQPIGLCGLIRRDGLEEVDFGVALLPAYRRQGYAYEAASAVLRYAKSGHSLNKLVAIALEHNQPCITLLDRLGFDFEKVVTLDGDTEELHLYSLSLDCL